MSDRHDSMRAQLRARREELRAKTTVDLLVPGYDGDLAVRYKAIPEDEFDKLVSKMQRGTNMDAALDLLAKACDCILVREGDVLEPLEDEDGPIGFDIRLAEFFGFTAEKTREIIRETFSPDGRHPLAPADHANAVTDWFRGKGSEIDETLLGE